MYQHLTKYWLSLLVFSRICTIGSDVECFYHGSN